jgi:hypothetical protein
MLLSAMSALRQAPALLMASWCTLMQASYLAWAASGIALL